MQSVLFNAYHRQPVINKHAPKKTIILRGNQKPHFNKNLHKQIITKSRLKNKTNRSKSSLSDNETRWQI